MVIRFDEHTIGYPSGYHFGVLEVHETDPVDGTIHTLRHIVVKDSNKLTVASGITNLASYVHPYDAKLSLLKNPTQQELFCVCEALNYFGRNGVKQLSEITEELVENFFDYYRDKPVNGNPEHFVSQNTLSLCVKTVVWFLGNLYKDGIISIQPESLMQARYLKNSRTHKEERKYLPQYNKQARTSAPINRIKDIPVEAVDMLLDLADTYMPMVSFAFTLQKAGGFRESEVMNIRQETSPLSEVPGIQYIKSGSKLAYFGVDLTREFTLRSDNVSVGLIKRKATDFSPIYEKNLDEVWTAYSRHLALLDSTPYEKEYSPMFVNRHGMAMTRQDYVYSFKTLITKYLRPKLLESNDPRLISFGELLQNCSIGPHVFRHFFTVRLVLDGADVGTVMKYRGDRNPESALAYLQGKDLFKRDLEETNQLCIQGLSTSGSYIYDNF